MAFVTSCDKADDDPTITPTPDTALVTEVTVPPITEIFSEGKLVTVKGIGFTKSDVIAIDVFYFIKENSIYKWATLGDNYIEEKLVVEL